MAVRPFPRPPGPPPGAWLPESPHPHGHLPGRPGKFTRRKRKGPKLPGTVQIPGILDDWYTKLVTEDPLYKQQLADIQAAGVQSGSQRRQLIQQALIKFGLVPSNLTDPYGDVDDLTRGLAESSTEGGLSTFAQLNRQEFDARRDLASRGILNSGEEVFQGREADRRLAGAEGELLEYLRGFAQAYAEGEAGRAAQTGQAAQDALERQMLLPGVTPPSDRAKSVAGPGSWYSLGGKLYNPEGQAIDVQKAIDYNLGLLRSWREKGMDPRRIRASKAYRKLQILRKYA